MTKVSMQIRPIQTVVDTTVGRALLSRILAGGNASFELIEPNVVEKSDFERLLMPAIVN